MNISNAERAKVLVHALPYIKKYNGKIVVIKYGGNAMIDEKLKSSVMKDIVLLSLIGVKAVVAVALGFGVAHGKCPAQFALFAVHFHGDTELGIGGACPNFIGENQAGFTFEVIISVSIQLDRRLAAETFEKGAIFHGIVAFKDHSGIIDKFFGGKFAADGFAGFAENMIGRNLYFVLFVGVKVTNT